MSPMFTVVSRFILPRALTTLSLTSYPRGVEFVGSESAPGQVLAGDDLLVLGVVTHTRVREQAD